MTQPPGGPRVTDKDCLPVLTSSLIECNISDDFVNRVAVKLANDFAWKLCGKQGVEGKQGTPGADGYCGPRGQKGDRGEKGDSFDCTELLALKQQIATLKRDVVELQSEVSVLRAQSHISNGESFGFK